MTVLESPPTAVAAMGRSWELSKGYRGKVLLTTLCAFLLLLVPSFAVEAIWGLLGGVAGDSGGVAQLVASSLLSMLIYPFFYVVLTVLYYDLRVRKEGFDLEVLASSLSLRVIQGSGGGRFPAGGAGLRLCRERLRLGGEARSARGAVALVRGGAALALRAAVTPIPFVFRLILIGAASAGGGDLRARRLGVPADDSRRGGGRRRAARGVGAAPGPGVVPAGGRPARRRRDVTPRRSRPISWRWCWRSTPYRLLKFHPSKTPAEYGMEARLAGAAPGGIPGAGGQALWITRSRGGPAAPPTSRQWRAPGSTGAICARGMRCCVAVLTLAVLGGVAGTAGPGPAQRGVPGPATLHVPHRARPASRALLESMQRLGIAVRRFRQRPRELPALAGRHPAGAGHPRPELSFLGARGERGPGLRPRGRSGPRGGERRKPDALLRIRGPATACSTRCRSRRRGARPGRHRPGYARCSGPPIAPRWWIRAARSTWRSPPAPCRRCGGSIPCWRPRRGSRWCSGCIARTWTAG